jgi:ankyrin repeat protein
VERRNELGFLRETMPSCRLLQGGGVRAEPVSGSLLLADADIDINWEDNFGWTALSHAASGGADNMAGLLMEKEARAHLPSSIDQIPLSPAALKIRAKVVERLIKLPHVNADTRDVYGQTLLQFAAVMSHWCDNLDKLAVIGVLFENEAGVNATDDEGRTPLSWAAERGIRSTVKWFLDHGATVGCQDQNGRSLLSWAVTNVGDAKTKLLIRYGAAVDCRDNKGRTPSDWAIKEKKPRPVRYLRRLERSLNSTVPEDEEKVLLSLRE